MAKIIIKDLTENKELDKHAMTSISGGFNPQPEPPAYKQLMANTRVQKNRFGLSRKRSCSSSGKVSKTINAKGIIIING